MRLVAITHNEFGSRCWAAPKGYVIAAKDALAPLVLEEIPSAVLSMPVAFIQQGEEFSLAAVQGLQQGKNLFVTIDGSWKEGYVPACYRSYPFTVASTQSGKHVLCFDQDSQLISAQNGQVFYGADGKLSESVMKIADFLTQLVQSRLLTRQVCSVLQQHNLIQPWAISVRSALGENVLSGLYKIDESALRQLSAEALQQLNQAGALSVAYLQLLSAHHLQKLGEMAAADGSAAAAKQQPTVDVLANESGTIDLSFLSVSKGPMP